MYFCRNIIGFWRTLASEKIRTACFSRPHRFGELILFVAVSFNGHSQDPVGTLSLPSENFIGEDFCFSYDLVNAGTGAGFNPYVRLFIPPGITFSDATYGSYTATSTVVGVLPSTPILDPIINSGTAADTIDGPAGHTLVILQVSVGSLVTNGPVLKFEICGSVDANATINTPVDILAQPVYELGDTPLGTNGPIAGEIESEPITPILFKTSKSGPAVINPGGGPAECHIYPYTLNVDIAAAGTLNGPIVFSDDLGADITYAGNLVLPGGCSAVEPAVGSTGGNLTITCGGSFAGSTDADDIVVQYDAYVQDILDETICDTKEVQNNVSFNIDGFPIELDSVETIVEHVTLSHSNDNDLVSVGQTVTYTINASITEYTAGINSAVIDFIVPDGMEYNETSLTFAGAPVSNTYYTVTPGPGNGATVSVDIHAFNGADFLPCASPNLVYTADVREFYGSGAKVLSRDDLSHTSTITYDLVEGANGCQSASGVGSVIQGVIISKTVNNLPPNGIDWLPGDTVQYRLELQIPSLDADDVVITDFFPIPIHDVADLSSSFGTDVSFDASSCWNQAPISYTIESATNSLKLEFGNVTDNESGNCVDIVLLIDIPITTVPFADNLFHSNFKVVSTDNSDVDDDIIDALTLINVLIA